VAFVETAETAESSRYSRYPMSWITILWSMIAAACLTLAAFYFVVWHKQRENWVHLLFSSSAVAAAAIAGFELAMIHAKTVGQYEALVRWIHLPAWVLIVSLVGFVRLYLHAGRRWLAWNIYGPRTLVLILNFSFRPNLVDRRCESREGTIGSCRVPLQPQPAVFGLP